MRKNVDNISQEMIETIKNKTAFALPNSPSAMGMKPDEIKEAFFRALVDNKESFAAEFFRAISEVNEVFEYLWAREVNHELRIKKGIISVDYNASDGVLTFTHDDGSIEKKDLPLELIVKSGEYDEVNNRIVLTLANGDKIYIDAAKLLGEFVGDGDSIEKTVSGSKYSFRLKPELLEVIRREDGARAAIEAHKEREDAHGIKTQISRAVFEHNVGDNPHPAIGHRLLVLEDANKFIASLVGVRFDYVTNAGKETVKKPPDNVMANALISEIHADAVVEDVFCDLTTQSYNKIAFENKATSAVNLLLSLREKYEADGVVYSASPGGETSPQLNVEISKAGRKIVTSNGDGPFMYFLHRYSRTFAGMGAFSLEIDFSEISVSSTFRIYCAQEPKKHFVLFSTTKDGRVLIFNRYPVSLEFGYKLRFTISEDISSLRVYHAGGYEDFYTQIPSPYLSGEEWKATMTRGDVLAQWRFNGAGTIAFSELSIYDGEVWEFRPTLKLVYPTEIVSSERSFVISDRIKTLCLKHSGVEGKTSYIDLLNRRFVIRSRVRDAVSGDECVAGVMLTDGKKTVVALNTLEYVDLSDELPADACAWRMPSDIEFRAAKEYEALDGETVTETDATVTSVISYQVERKG